jgi:hypothetical protein
MWVVDCSWIGLDRDSSQQGCCMALVWNRGSELTCGIGSDGGGGPP